jgi:hypothetical protein
MFIGTPTAIAFATRRIIVTDIDTEFAAAADPPCDG